MNFGNQEANEQSEQRRWASNFFGNVAFAIVIVGGLLTGQGLGGTFVLALMLVAVMFILALCASVVPGGRKRERREQASSVIGVLLCVAAIGIVLIG